jgi:hypothetical protein
LILAHYTGPFTNKTWRKETSQRSSEFLFIFLEAFSGPFVTTVEAASQLSPGRRGGLTARRISRVRCLPGASANSSTLERILRFHHRQPEQCSDFFQRSSFLRLTGSTTSSPEEDDDAPALDPWTGLPSLSADVGVDRHRRTKEAGRNYSSTTSSLRHRRRRQENQAAEEPSSTSKT